MALELGHWPVRVELWGSLCGDDESGGESGGARVESRDSGKV